MFEKSSLSSRLQQQLEKRFKENNFRRLLISNTERIDFFSNDYLGLARNQNLFEQIVSSYNTYSQQYPHTKNGSTGSRLLSGHSSFFEKLETELTYFFEGEKALFFASGYHANVALLSSILTRHDVILSDQFAHASLKEGYRLSQAQHFTFRHNDLEDLERKLQQFKTSQNTVLIVVESVYSMDGDIAPLQDLAKLCEQYQTELIVDEAHSTGIFGKNGNGLVCELGLQKHVFARVHTFGKAFGSQGAVVLGNETLIHYLINFALPFIYTTAPPLFQLVSVYETIQFLKKHQPALSQNLEQNILLFNTLNSHQETSLTPIKTILTAGNEACVLKAELLQQKGFEVRPIRSPTVAKGSERIRICLHNFNTEEEIRRLCLELSS